MAGIKCILKSSKSLKSLAAQNPLHWPTIKLVSSRIQEEDDGNVYQGALLHSYSPTVLQHCANQVLSDLQKLDEQMRSRLEWSDVEMLRAILVFLDTHSWCVSDGDDGIDELKAAVEYISTHFREPLEAAQVDLARIQDEVEDAIDYARAYLNITKECYRKVWYKLHIAPDADKWPNVLALCQLLFSLPFSNGRVERIFSTLKVIKTDRRTNLREYTKRPP